MNRLKVKIKRLLKSTKDSIVKAHTNKVLLKYLKNNMLFVAYILVNVLNATLLRFFTIHSWSNYLSLRAIISDMIVVVILGAFSYLLKPKNRPLYLMCFTILFTLICIINSVYFTYYSSFASLSMLGLIKYVGQVGDAVVENVIQLKDLIYLIGPVFQFYVYKKQSKRNVFKKIEIKQKRKKGFFTALSIGGVLAILFVITMKPLDVSRFAKQWNKEYIVMRFGIYIYQGEDVVTSLKPQINSMFGYDEANKKFELYFEEREKYDQKNKYTNIFKGKNILVIHGESMMVNAMTQKFEGKEVTPNLNKLASTGMFFDNFYSQTSVGTSSDSELTSTTSLMPTKSGTAFVSYYNRTYNATPKLLSQNGYYTFSMHANNGSFWNRMVMYDALGYIDFYDKEKYEVTKENSVGLGLSDKEFFKQSIPYLQEINQNNKNWYGLMIMLSNHTPFSDVEHYGDFPVTMTKNGKTYDYMEGTKLGNYFKAVHYADEALGELINELKEAKLLDNTVIVLYGDHDARLSRNEYDLLYNYNPETNKKYDEDDPQYDEYDEYEYELGRKVPFIIWTQDMEGTKLNKKVSYPMGMYDVQPTLGNMFGFKNEYALGHDIFSIKNKNIVCFANGNWLNKNVYHNAQKRESYQLNKNPINQEEVQANTEYTNKLLDVSNDIIVFDLLKNKAVKEDNNG